eukprot:TRINITY_DN10155_c0_g1_i2.p1 TRINITY_DN10155_c0_g1~~TRINITY_DN10155_c0_g1_i2.p1  ORF type:complete len:191 (-),score=53.91 TRINITY_DN10155_c0_g1_i2:225-797(-)
MNVNSPWVIMWVIFSLFYYLILFRVQKELFVRYKLEIIDKTINYDSAILCNPESGNLKRKLIDPTELRYWEEQVKENVERDETLGSIQSKIDAAKKEMEELRRNHTAEVEAEQAEIEQLQTELLNAEQEISTKNNKLRQLKTDMAFEESKKTKIGEEILKAKEQKKHLQSALIILTTSKTQAALNCTSQL